MKRLSSLVLISLLALTGCNQSTPDTKTSGSAQPAAPSAGKPDTASETARAGSFTPQTRPLISSEDVPLLEQINRENVRVVAAASPSVVRVTAVGPVDPHAQIF